MVSIAAAHIMRSSHDSRALVSPDVTVYYIHCAPSTVSQDHPYMLYIFRAPYVFHLWLYRVETTLPIVLLQMSLRPLVRRPCLRTYPLRQPYSAFFRHARFYTISPRRAESTDPRMQDVSDLVIEDQFAALREQYGR